MNNVKIQQRLLVLDRLLNGPGPVSSEVIFSEWNKVGVRSRANSDSGSLMDQYSILLRQDLHLLNQLYDDSQLSIPPFEKMLIVGRDEHNKKMRTYHYSRSDFSMKPLIEEKYIQSDWSVLDTILDKIIKKVPSSLADKINFFVRSRLDILKGRIALVEWTDPLSIGWYAQIPEIYRHAQKNEPLTIEYRFFIDQEGKYDNATVHPYMIKSYRGHWYCLAYVEEKKRIMPLAIDRIKPGSIKKITGKLFIDYPGEIDSKGRIKYFDDIIGVTKGVYGDFDKDKYITDNPFDLQIKIHDYKVWWYLRTDPIHSSYTIIESFDPEKGFGRVRFHLKGNIEMYKNLMYLGPNVEVEAPSFVRKNIKELADKQSALYKNDK